MLVLLSQLEVAEWQIKASKASGAPQRAKGASHLKRNEFTLVVNVKPGHEKQIREGIYKLASGEAGGDPLKIASDSETTLHDARFVLIDNDSRLVFLTSYEGDWDKYFDDHFSAFGKSFNVSSIVRDLETRGSRRLSP